MEDKKKKIYLIVIACLAVLIIGLGAFILGYKSKNKDEASGNQVAENADNETTVAVSEEVTDTSADDTTAVEENTESTTEKKESGDADKVAAFVRITPVNGWDNNGKYSCQFDGTIVNKTSSDITNWKAVMTGLKGAALDNSWNATYKLSGETLEITSVDYNETVPAGGSITFGFIVTIESSSVADEAAKTPVLYVNGELFAGNDESLVADKAEETKTEETKTESNEESNPPAAESGTPVANHGKLSVNGTDIVDKNGKVFQLKGVSTHGIAWFPEYVNKDAFQTLRDDWGANLIRLAMYTDENGGYCSGGSKETLKKKVTDGVDYATELGMYVIIDWHILHDLTPLKYKDDAKTFFDEMSKKYANNENVIYEICNEPNGGTSWADVKKYAEEIIPVIRANDKDAIIIVGTPNWSQDVDDAAKNPITGYDNIMYAVHFYAATHKGELRKKIDVARDKGLAVFISEFSICDASGNGGIDYTSSEEWLKYLNDKNMSFASWSLSNKNETSALINSSCSKKSGWTDDELSEAGKWIKKQIKGQ